MGPEWLAALVAALVAGTIAVLKGFWGTDKPQETTVEHPEPEIEVDDGKTDSERLKDLGL